MPEGSAARERSRSRSRGAARRSRRAGRDVRESGRLAAPAVVWTGGENPEWFTRLSTQLQRLPADQKPQAAVLLDQLAGVLLLQGGVAN